MVISEQDLKNLAQLAGLALAPGQATAARAALNEALSLAQAVQEGVDPAIVPMVQPLAGQLRLREDVARAPASPAERDALMANAPATAQGLFLVPTVLE
ncbi:MAG: Asp-tRNA(Asn)/Glu-tRNA(Gln) amidotransferase subunit GatC [Castellaniella sp.]